MDKFILYFFIFVLSFSCTKKEAIPNNPPADFLVSVNLGKDGKTVVLNWSKAVDPDGDKVSYSIFLDGSFKVTLVDTTFNLGDLGFDFNKTGVVIAKDEKGLEKEVVFAVKTLEDPYVSFSDENFEKFLVNNKIDKDGIVNHKMEKKDAIGVKELLMNSLNIVNLKGLEVFKDLEKLAVSKNLLTELDVSNNQKLVTIFCSYNGLKKLKLKGNLVLQNLICDSNNLDSLNITDCIELKTLQCFSNSLNVLDLTKNYKLENLYCSSNKLTNLDLTKNINLIHLSCSSNSLTSLDVTKNINLSIFQCYLNKISSINLKSNVNLATLDCSNNTLFSLDLRNNLILRSLDCSGNKLTILDLTKNPDLSSLDSRDNPLTTICVKDVNKAKANSAWLKGVGTFRLCD
ncbi:hypothetical protein MCERE19_02845 [Spirosomataceae bacterium]